MTGEFCSQYEQLNVMINGVKPHVVTHSRINSTVFSTVHTGKSNDR